MMGTSDSNPNLKRRMCWVVAATVAWFGCSKHKDASGAPPVPADATAPADPAATPADPTQGQPQNIQSAQPTRAQPAAAQEILTPAALEGAVHPQMTLLLRKYIQQNRRMPKSFTEFGSSMMDSVPFPPAGMEFVIDETTREVKVRRLRK
jgi:hypothetical protein